MTPADLASLRALSQAVQDADAAKLRDIKAEEARIRAQLAALDNRNREARDMPWSEKMHHHRLGGDLLWQVWVGQKRRDLQIQLAQCLARQGSAKRALQKSFGKQAALRELHQSACEEVERTTSARSWDAANAMAVLRPRDP